MTSVRASMRTWQTASAMSGRAGAFVRSGVVVIGADAAGMSAASRAKRIAGDAVEIVAFERGAYSSFSACGIPYWVAGDVDGPERLVARSPEAHRNNGIDLRMRTELEQIDLGAG